MSSTTAPNGAIKDMPGAGSTKAPAFTGNSSDLLEFFEEFERLAHSCGISNQDKCWLVLRYVDTTTKRFWVTLPGYEAQDYNQFKEEIFKKYPGSEKGVRYTYRDLERVVIAAAELSISTEAELLQYYRQFSPIAIWLMKQGKLSGRERDMWFWEGLPVNARRAISRRLELQNPRTFSRSDPIDYDDVLEAGQFVFSDEAFDIDVYNPVSTRFKSLRPSAPHTAKTSAHLPSSRLRLAPESDDEEDCRIPSALQDVRTKTVHVNSTNPISKPTQADELEELGRRMHSLSVEDSAYAGCYTRMVFLAPTIAQMYTPPARMRTVPVAPTFQHTFSASAALPAPMYPPSNARCFMCGGPHRLSDCTVVTMYIQAGRIIRQDRFLAFPDYSRIPRHPTTGLLQTAIDERYGGPLLPPAGVVPRVSEPVRSPDTLQDPPPATTASCVADTESYLFQCVPVAEASAVIVDADEDYDVLAITRNQGKAARERKEESSGKSVDERGKKIGTLKERVDDKEIKTPNLQSQNKGKAEDDHAATHSFDLKKNPAYTYESKAANPDAAKQTLDRVLNAIVPSVTVSDLLAISPDLRREVVEFSRTHRIPTSNSTLPTTVNVCAIAPVHVEYSTPLREMKVTLNGVHEELALLDKGSEIVVIREDIWHKSQAAINPHIRMRMQTANGSTQDMPGCVEMLEVLVDGIKTWVHAYVIPKAPYRLLLGRPWQRLVRLSKDETDDDVFVTIRDPCSPSSLHRIATTPRPFQGPADSMAFYASVRASISTALMMSIRPTFSQLTATSFAEEVLRTQYDLDPIHHVFAYKKVANKVKPVATTMPQHARIIRRIPEDPLLTLQPLSFHPPDFTPGRRLTLERVTELGILANSFLWPEERKLAAQILLNNEMGLAWDESEKGRFREDYFPPVVIPTVEHTPWVHRQPPIPPGIREKVIEQIKAKISSGVYEPSNSSYQSQWFCVAKKNGSIRIVHDLQPLNAITIKDAATLPYVEHFAEQSAGRSIYTMMDLFVGYDHRPLAEASRDLTTFQTPLGTFRLTVLPQGWTDSPAVFQNDVAFILQAEVDIAPNFQDDINVLGPRTRYELPDGSFETIPQNPGIRRFVWEHCLDVNRVLYRLTHAGATVSAKKLFLCHSEVMVVGQTCNYDGRIPDNSKVSKIHNWPSCETKTEVRGFLGIAGTIRIWIKDFATLARPLVHLTKVHVPFSWGPDEQSAMDQLKLAIINSPAIRPIDYQSHNEVILAVDSSQIAVGYILSQIDDDKRRRPSRFGSITWNERESRYSQAKIELYGLFRALRAVKVWIIGVKNFTVEVDAQYIKGMLNNPDIQPNASMNRWLAGIQTFDFKLRHVSAIKHQGPDGLSRRRRTVDEDEDETTEEVEEWIDEVLGCGIWVAGGIDEERLVVKVEKEVLVLSVGKEVKDETTNKIPTNETTKKRDDELHAIKAYLTTLSIPSDFAPQQRTRLTNNARQFFVRGNHLWRKDRNGRHQIVLLANNDRLRVLRETHDQLGHRGIYPTRRTIADRFWWPALDLDIAWYIKTCHQCQIRSVEKVVLPPVVATPAPLFRKAYIDSMHMPKAHGYSFIVQARCSLSAWPEWRMLRTETARTLGAFIFEEILCRWGGLEEIVSDNGTPFVAALEWLAEKYHIRHIRISAYNSQSNGIVERSHRTIRDSLVKACNGDITQWPVLAPHVFWADRVTTRKSTGHSPYFIAHGVEPLLPFDITEATFLLPEITSSVDSATLIAIRARQLAKREDDLAEIHTRVLRSRFASITDFERRFASSIHDYNFDPGSLVLVLNKKIEPLSNAKCKPRYFGPMVVVRRAQNGSYRLAEVDGSVSKLKFAAFRLVPYHARSLKVVEVTQFVDPLDLAGLADED